MKRLVFFILLVIPTIFINAQFETKGITELDYIEKTCNDLLGKIKDNHLVFEEIDKLSDEDLYNFTVNVYNANAKHYILTQKMFFYYAKRTRYNFIYRKGKDQLPYGSINFTKLKKFILEAAKERIGEQLPEHYFELIDVPYIWRIKVISSARHILSNYLPVREYEFIITYIVKSDELFNIADTVKVVSSLSKINKLDINSDYLVFVSLTSDNNNKKYAELYLKPLNFYKLPHFTFNGKIIFEEKVLEYKGTFDWSKLKGELIKKYGGSIK